jgi:hypothetical protein
MVPNIVALGTVFSGWRISAAGIVAHSIPKKAYSVREATADRDEKLLSPVKLKEGKLSSLKKNNPNKIINNKGTIFMIVVNN